MKINQEVKDWVNQTLPDQNFDSVAIGLLNLDTYEFDTCQLGKRLENRDVKAYFDLASLTKPLTFLPWYYKYEKLFTEERKLLLNHQAGLPLSGRLHRDTWKEQIKSYKIQKSPTLYSDFSPLRLMLDLEDESGVETADLVFSYFDKEVKHWTQLTGDDFVIPTGRRGDREICGKVHDDKALVIKSYCAHAGLFSTIDGLVKTIAGFCRDYDLLKRMNSSFQNEEKDQRFRWGFDTVSNPVTSLAGKKSDNRTFGHLGFTGTSMWISEKNKRAIILLTNETNGFWYDRDSLRNFRIQLHDKLWDADS